ncbi:MAG TPA: hypothetical protein VMY38_00790 [Gemmatimonadaceae bacterium]|nr:hypothetical protein [Gemmatimonadaceae bacterium]
MKRHMRASLVAIAAFSLMSSPLAAQSAREGSPPAEVKTDGAKATQVLATEAAARLGISRSESAVDAKAPAMQQQSQTMKWIIILGVAVLAAILIMAVAD